MPIIDHDAAHEWFVMPMADENLAACFVAKRLSDGVLLDVLRAAVGGLAAAHARGLVHRDVSPRNILRIGAQWVVADWGVVRRPPGMTTMIRTQGELGSLGFAAPELFTNAHAAGPPADVYALGRIAAWALTRKWPEQNVPLVPTGPWRQLVRRATEHDQSRRPQTILELSGLLNEVESALATEQTEAGVEGNVQAPDLAPQEWLEYALSNPDDADALIYRLPAIEKEHLARWVVEREADVERLVESVDQHLMGRAGTWTLRDFDDANAPMTWLRSVAALAAVRQREGLLEDATGALMRAEARWQRFTQRHLTRTWLETLSDRNARTVARVLVRHPASRAWLLDEGWSPAGTSPEIRSALLMPPSR
jgi:serine/threonine protein kinase